MQLSRSGCSAVLLAALALIASTGQARAQGATTASLDVLGYTDTDNVNSLTPQVAVVHQFDEDGGRVGARVVVDAVSTASVDIVSTASYRFSEIRTEAAFDAGYRVGDYLPGVDYRFSREPDYVSHTMGGGGTARLGTSDSVLGVHYGLTLDQVGMVDTPASVFSRSLTGHNIDLSFTQILSPRTLLRVSYALAFQHGYMEKPYRSVPLFDAAGLQAAQRDGATLNLDTFDNYRLAARPPEEVPNSRHRHAWALRVMHYLSGLRASLRVDYRFYVDSWSVLGNTAELALHGHIAGDWKYGISARLYHQTGASFWKRQYVVDGPDRVPAIRTMDRQLSPYYAGGGAVRVEWAPEPLAMYVSVGATRTEYLDYLLLDDRWALTSQAGFQWTF